LDENSLIEFAQQGDLDAFNRLILLYQETAFNLAARLMNDPAAADDAVQEAFISAYKHLRSFRGGSFRAWVLRIVTNACYDEMRRRKRRPTVPLEPLSQDDEEIESPAWLADPGESPEEAAVRHELGRAIQDCLDRLPVEFRTVVVMIDIEGLDYEEAASAIHKPLGTIKSRVSRARQRLQDCLKGFRELLPASLRFEEELAG